jgi:hypothetical protein
MRKKASGPNDATVKKDLSSSDQDSENPEGYSVMYPPRFEDQGHLKTCPLVCRPSETNTSPELLRAIRSRREQYEKTGNGVALMRVLLETYDAGVNEDPWAKESLIKNVREYIRFEGRKSLDKLFRVSPQHFRKLERDEEQVFRERLFDDVYRLRTLSFYVKIRRKDACRMVSEKLAVTPHYYTNGLNLPLRFRPQISWSHLRDLYAKWGGPNREAVKKSVSVPWDDNLKFLSTFPSASIPWPLKDYV